MFEGIITSARPVQTSTTSETTVITYNDSNVFNYTTGFVCQKIYNTVNCSTRPDNAGLVMCIKALLKEEDVEEPESQSATWVNEVDRGGLWHVQEGTVHTCYLQPWERRFGSIFELVL